MPTDLIRYDLLVQDALKSVVRNVLSEAARDGLPGNHHFCITFRTRAPGVELSKRVQDQHPDELTIILQHQFWDLIVTEQNFEVGLSFGGVPERLAVPFEAVTGFWDPSVQFGLKFEVQDEAPQAGANDAAPVAAPTAQAPKIPLKSAAGPRASEPAGRPPAEPVPKSRPQKSPGVSKSSAPAGEKAADDAAAATGDKVVSIDAFRKKT